MADSTKLFIAITAVLILGVALLLGTGVVRVRTDAVKAQPVPLAPAH